MKVTLFANPSGTKNRATREFDATRSTPELAQNPLLLDQSLHGQPGGLLEPDRPLVMSTSGARQGVDLNAVPFYHSRKLRPTTVLRRASSWRPSVGCGHGAARDGPRRARWVRRRRRTMVDFATIRRGVFGDSTTSGGAFNRVGAGVPRVRPYSTGRCRRVLILCICAVLLCICVALVSPHHRSLSVGG